MNVRFPLYPQRSIRNITTRCKLFACQPRALNQVFADGDLINETSSQKLPENFQLQMRLVIAS